MTMTAEASAAEHRDELRRLPQPEPSLGLAAYRRERELALAADPRRAENYRKYMASSRRSAKVDYLPVKLDVENVSRCNFRCTMCVVSDWPHGKRAGDLSLDAFKALIDEQYGLLEIKLQGIGEPTMQGDDFFAMIRYARAKHIWVRTTTNASLLHLKDNYRKLVDSGVNEIQISVDGADEATFTKIRRGAVFKRVMSNIRMINAYCRERNITLTKMWTVVQQGNIHQLDELVDLAADLGFPQSVFSLNLSDWGIDAWSDRNRAVDVETRLTADRLMALHERGKALGLGVRFWNVVEKYNTDSREGLCPWPFERAYVSSDARIVPCCYLGNPDVLEFQGAKAGFTSVWQGQAYEAFRQAHLDGDIPPACRGCYKAGQH